MNTFRRSYQISRSGEPSLHVEFQSNSDNRYRVSIISIDDNNTDGIHDIDLGDLSELVAIASAMAQNHAREMATCTTTAS